MERKRRRKEEIEEIVNEVMEIVYKEISGLRQQEGRIEWLDTNIRDSIEEWKKEKIKEKG